MEEAVKEVVFRRLSEKVKGKMKKYNPTNRNVKVTVKVITTSVS